MVALITGEKWFRWHDSGDIQSLKHLENIFTVCKRTSKTRHWMPTREAQFLKQLDPATIPSNLIIRMSSHMIDQGPVKFWPWTSTVTSSNNRPARRLIKATSAEAADSAGTGRPQTCVTVNINMWHHPKYYAALRKQGRKLTSSQASSQNSQAPESQNQGTSAQAHGPGCKQQG